MNTSKMPDSKFSAVEEPDEMEVYEELEKFIWYLAYQNQDPNNVMMEVEEIVGELMLELAKGLKFYNGLPSGQMQAVLRKMMDNRVSELKFRYYVSGRRIPLSLTVSLDLEVGETGDGQIVMFGVGGDDNLLHEFVPAEFSSPEEIYESMENVVRVRQGLSEVAQLVFDAVVFGNEQLTDVMYLSALRAAAVFKNKTIRLKSRHIADALLLDDRAVRKAFREIRLAYAEVCNG